jgi:tetratricopeptide (TPR) repeat protein
MRRHCWMLASTLALSFVVALSTAQAQSKKASKPKEPAASAESAEAAASTAPPENEAAVKEAAERYERGLQLYSEGEAALALIEFERAHDLVSDYRVLYNIGQVRIQLGRYASARDALQQYLEQSGDDLPPDRKTAVEADLQMLVGRTAHLKVITNEPGAEIVMDGIVVGQTPMSEPLLVDAGVRAVAVQKQGFQSNSTRISLAGRDERELTLNITKIPEVKTEPGRVVVEKRIEREVVRPRQTDDTLMWIGWTATGTLALGAGIAGYFGITKANDLESMRTDYGVKPDQLNKTKSQARTLFIIADLAGAAAVVLGSVSLYLTLQPTDSGPPERDSQPKKAPGATVGLGVGPGQVSVSGTF